MSWRQAALNSTSADAAWMASTNRRREVRSVRNGRHLARAERFEEAARPLEIELWIPGLDAQEKLVAGRQREPRDVEDRVIRHRQAVEREHAEHGRQRGTENRAFERDRYEHRPGIERFAADVQRVGHRRGPVLKKVAADAANDAADEDDQRQLRMMLAERV